MQHRERIFYQHRTNQQHHECKRARPQEWAHKGLSPKKQTQEEMYSNTARGGEQPRWFQGNHIASSQTIPACG